VAVDDRAAIEVRGLAKRFAEVQAVASVDFDVGQGEWFSLRNIKRKWIV